MGQNDGRPEGKIDKKGNQWKQWGISRDNSGESKGNPRRNNGWDISRDIVRESEGKQQENMRT